MAKKKDEQKSPEELLAEAQAGDDVIEGIDEVPVEAVPSIELLTAELQRSRDNWRFATIAVLVAIVIMAYGFDRMFEDRKKDHIYVYNQATGQIAQAKMGNYTADGYMAGVARTLYTLFTWDTRSFNTAMSLASATVDDTIIKAMRATFRKNKNIWDVDEYRQRLIIKKVAWPFDNNGRVLKWMPGQPEFAVVVDGTFERQTRTGSDSSDVRLSVTCRLETPSVSNPDGYRCYAIRKEKAQ